MSLKFESLFRQVLVLVSCSAVVHCIIHPTVAWTPDNPAFNQSYSLSVEAYSKIIIKCPNPTTILSEQYQSRSRDSMYENFWVVDKKGYDTCQANTSNGDRLLKVCDTPEKLDFYEIVFQLFDPGNGLAFTQGKEYYFISTSNGNKWSLDHTSGGHCQSNNMRLKFYLCLGTNDPKCQSSSHTTSAPIVPSVTTVTKTVTHCPPMGSLAPIDPGNLINPSPSTSVEVSNTINRQSLLLPGAAIVAPNIVQSKYASVLSSLDKSSIKPTASQLQSSTTQLGGGFIQPAI